MEAPTYLEVIERITIDPGSIRIAIEPQSIVIPVVDVNEAIAIAPKYQQEFIDRNIPYNTYFHFHTHGVNIKDNLSCFRTELTPITVTVIRDVMNLIKSIK